MKTKIATRSFLLCYSIIFCALGQEESKKTFKHDLGFNTSIVLQGIFNPSATTTPFSLMYKRYTSEDKAWRYGLTTSLNFASSNIKGPGTTAYNVQNNLSLTLSFGKEFQKAITEKWVWYYGGDALPGYTINQSESYSPPGTKVITSTVENLSFVARPFIGVRFNIHPRLYVSSEFSANFTYRYSRASQHNFNSGEMSETKTNNFILGLSPASALFFFYRF